MTGPRESVQRTLPRMSTMEAALPGRRLTALLLLLVVVLIVLSLIRFTAAGPTFRAADHPNLEQCLGSIPHEWLPGSLERERAERACLHRERQRRGQR